MTPAESEPDDVPPWQQAGAVRRDCDPHRGHWLILLARLALGFTAVALVLTVGLMADVAGPRLPVMPPRRAAALLLCVAAGVLALAGIVLGACVRAVAGHDLGRMAAGEVDVGGERLTRAARHRANQAVLLGGVLVLAVVGVVVLWARH